MTVRCTLRPCLLAVIVSAVAFAAMLLPQPASAQQPDPFATEGKGTANQRDACQTDAMSLCNEFIPNIPAIEACLKRKVKSLSPACRVAVSGTTWRKKSSAAVH